MSKKRTIYPPEMFSEGDYDININNKIMSNKNFEFWEAIADKKTMTGEGIFVYFVLPDNTVIYEWFKKQASTKHLYGFVNYVINNPDFKLKSETGFYVDQNQKISNLINIHPRIQVFVELLNN